MNSQSNVLSRAKTVSANVFMLWALTASILYLIHAFNPLVLFDRQRILAVMFFEAALFLVLVRAVPGSFFSGAKQSDGAATELNEEGTNDRGRAISYCKGELSFYEKVCALNLERWQFTQVWTIVLGAIATVLASVPSPAIWFVVIRSVAIAGTTIAAGLNSSFSFQREYARQGSAADLLRGELIKFQTRSEPYSVEATAVNEFLVRVRAIVGSENQNWVSSSQTNNVPTNEAK